MSPLRLTLAAAFLASAAPIAAHAARQDVAADTTNQLLRQNGLGTANDTFVTVRAANPNTGELTNRFTTLADISAGSEGGVATINFAYHLDQGAVYLNDPSGTIWDHATETWSVVLSAPVDKSSDHTDIFSNSGVPGGFSAKFGFSRFSTHVWLDTDAQVRLRDAALAPCYADVVHDKAAQGLSPALLKQYQFEHCDQANADTIEDKYLGDTGRAPFFKS